MGINRERLQDRQRFTIISTGRSGSTLLSAVLAGAGANFNMANVTEWDPKSGEYEHPLLHSARRWQSRMEKIEASLIPDVLGRNYCARRMQRDLARLLGEAHYVKSTQLIWLVHPIYQLDFWPRIIVSYRSLAETVRSRFMRFGWSVPKIVTTYRETYSTAALQLQLFGGCVVNYDDVINPQETAWADALAKLTGLEREKILESRAAIVRQREKPTSPPLFDMNVLDPSTEMLYQMLEGLRGQVIEPA